MQAVDGPELVERRLDEAPHRLLVGEVELDGDRVAAGRHDALRGGGGARNVVVADGNAGAFGGEAFGGGRADPGGAPGHHKCLAGQAAHHTYPTPMSTDTWVAVTNLDWSEASQATASAMSSGCAMPSGSSGLCMPRRCG